MRLTNTVKPFQRIMAMERGNKNCLLTKEGTMPNLLSKVVSDGTTHVTDATTSPASDDATGKPEGTPGTVKTYDEKTFKEVVGQRDELKKRLIKLEEDAKKREETALTEQGKF